MIKTNEENSYRRTLSQSSKIHSWLIYCQHHINLEKSENFPSKIKIKTFISTITLLFNIELKILQKAIRKQKEIIKFIYRNGRTQIMILCSWYHWKGRTQIIILCSWHHSLHKRLKYSIKKLLELTPFQPCIRMQKSIAFSYINNWLEKIIPFTAIQMKTKYL